MRRATLADAVSIVSCLQELGYGTSAVVIERKLTETDRSDRDAVFVAISALGGEPVGVISLHVLPLFHAEGSIGRITSLAVRRDAQGSGAGRALVEAAEDFAWRHDCRRIEVTSGDHRPGAHAFYEAIGYSVDERRFIKHAPGITTPVSETKS